MLSKCINATSGRKYLTENGFGDIDFQHDVESLAVRRCLLPTLAIFSLCMRSLDDIITSGLKSDVIFEFSAPVFL